MSRTTLEDIKSIDKEFLAPRDVSGFLGCDPYNITLQARADPAKLGFPVVVIGTRTKIPKKAFINFFEGVKEETL